MGNRPDGLVMSQARDRAAIHNVEDTSFGPGCGVGRLVENAPHVAVALRGSVAVVYPRTLVVAGASTNPRGETFLGGKGRCRGTDFGNDLLCRVHSQTRHLRQPPLPASSCGHQFPLFYRTSLPPGRERRACCGYLNQARGLSPLPQGKTTTPNYSLHHARSGSDSQTASISPLCARPRRSGPFRSYLWVFS
jgi:hypothetical protein